MQCDKHRKAISGNCLLVIMKRLVYETSKVPCFQLVPELWIVTSWSGAPFIICQLYSCTSQLKLQEISAFSASAYSSSPSCQLRFRWSKFSIWGWAAAPSYMLRFVDLTSASAVWNKQANTRAAPPRLLPWCSSAQCGKSTPNADICHIHLAASVKPSLPFPSPPPNQIKLPRIFQLWVNERATGLGQIVLMAAFPLIYSCVYSSLLSCPSPPVKRRQSCLVTSGVICARHDLRLHLWTRNRRGFHTSSVILSRTERGAELRQDQSVDMFIIVLAITWLQRRLDMLLLSNNLLLFISDRPDRLTR